MLMNGGGERETHNCFDRMRGSLRKMARLCSAGRVSILGSLIPVATGGYEPEPLLADLAEFKMDEYQESLMHFANDLVDFIPPVAVATAAAYTAVVALAQDLPVASALPDSPPSPAVDESVIFLGNTVTARTGPTPQYTYTASNYTGLGMVLVSHTAPHTLPTQVHRDIILGHRRHPAPQ